MIGYVLHGYRKTLSYTRYDVTVVAGLVPAIIGTAIGTRRSVSSHTGCDATSVGTSQTSCDATMTETSHARCEATGSLAASGFMPDGPEIPSRFPWLAGVSNGDLL